MKRKKGARRGIGSLQFLNLPSHVFSSDEDSEEEQKKPKLESTDVSFDPQPLISSQDKSEEEVIEISDSEDIINLVSSPAKPDGLQSSKVINAEIQSSKVQSSKAQSSKAQSPEIQGPEIQSSMVQISKAQNPKAQSPEIQSPEIQSPEIQISKVQSSIKQNSNIPGSISQTSNEQSSNIPSSISQSSPPPAAHSNTLPTRSSKPIRAATSSNSLPSNLHSTVDLHILCDIPGKQFSRFQTHGTNLPFYSLEKEFGRDSVFLFNNEAFKKFMTPSKLCAGAPSMEIHVVTEPQWRAIQLGEGEEQLEEAKSPSEDMEESFSIVLEGKEGQVKVLVTPVSIVANLVRHYLTTWKLPLDSTVIVKFDGDKVDLNSTLDQLDLEEDDKLEIHA